MGFSFGGFAGGLVSGYERGLAIGEKVDKLNKRNKVRELIQEGLAQKEAADAAKQASGRSSVVEAPAVAGQAYQSDSGAVVTPIANPADMQQAPLPQTIEQIDPMSVPSERSAPIQGVSEAPPSLSTQSPAPDAPTPATTAAGGLQAAKYMDGEKSFDTRAAAQESATGKIQSKDEYLVKSIYPKVRDYYMAQGDLEGAKHWDEYAKSKRGEAVNTAWAKMVTAPDLESMTKYGRDLYEFIDDGVTTTGHKLVTKSDGTQVAVVTLKDKKTGKESEMELTRERLMQLGGMANPQKMYDDYKAQEKEMRTFKAKAAITAAHDAALLGRQQAMQDRVDNRADARDDRKAQRDEALVRLKNELSTSGADRYKKTTDPEERAAIIDKEFKDDPAYKKLDENGRKQFIKQKMQAYRDIGDEMKDGKGSAAPAGGTQYFIDNKTGQPVMLKNGKIVPLAANKPAQAPAAPAVQPAQPTPPSATPKVAANGLPREPFKRFMEEKSRAAQGQ
jgi:hypothetical protein